MVMCFVFRVFSSRDRCGWQRGRGNKGKCPSVFAIGREAEYSVDIRVAVGFVAYQHDHLEINSSAGSIYAETRYGHTFIAL